MLLNSVSKLGLFRAFDDPGVLCVDIEAVVEALKKKRQCSSALAKEDAINDLTSEFYTSVSVIHRTSSFLCHVVAFQQLYGCLY